MSPDALGETRDHTPPDQPEASPQGEPGAESPFPIVGIGASAGGLEAFTQLLAHLPARTGMAFVLVQHLDPRHESRLTDLLARATQMPVIEASQGLPVEPDHVYIIPPNTTMAIARGALQITPRGEAPGPHLPVNHFLRALALAQQAQAIGVVFSGTGSDGTLGLLEIKTVGGITFAQEPGSARHGGMPHSAIGSGAVDFVLPPEEIGDRLAEIGAHPYLAPGPVEAPPPESEDHFRRVLGAVRAATGVDLSQYRDTTIRRRILRRMALHGESSLASYVGRLEQDAPEVEALYRDLLINVTSFFRDPALFEALKTSVFPEILKAKFRDAPLRLWVPGCSTGQEAYSLAIALWELFDDKPVRHPFQIFGTDLSDPGSLERARAGLYPESIEAELTPERLQRFFKKEDHLYRIDKTIRDSCVFARQNLTADPPFSHVDLISCRNVLIYMAPALQRRVLPTFHYALNVPGFLVLGSAETVGEFNGLFQVTDRANKIYAKQVTGSRPLVQFAIEDHQAPRAAGPRAGAPGSTPADFQKEADRLLLSRYAPPGVLVNGHLDILQFRGRTGPYLEAPPGEPTMNLLKMARPGLFVELRSAVNEAIARGETVRREGLRLHDEQGVREVAIEVLPVRPREAAAQCCLVLFEEGGGPKPAPGLERPPEEPSGWRARLYRWSHPRPRPAANVATPAGREELTEPGGETARLRQELSSTREYLQSLVEQQDAANEELRSANEEVLSSNEELQSTNEELETAKEELQSTNEELSTVNEQLQHRNLELNHTTNDLQNLLASTSIPVVMVGPDLRIRRLTPPARKIMNLLPADLGRPIGDLKANVDVPDLEALIAEVIDQVQPREREVRDREGRRYALRVHPYRTGDNKIDGAVLVLLDIEDLKRSQEEASEARDYAEAIVATVREPLIILDGELRVVTANVAFYRTFGVQPAETQERLVYDLGDQQWDIPALRRLLEEVLPRETAFEGLEVQHDFPRIGQKTMLLNARGLYRANRASLILLAIEDVTGSRQEAEKLSYQATHDRLTGLINRGEFERRFQRVLGTAEARDPHALLYLDLDQFKLVNDTAGHRAGDELLRQLAVVLEAKTRKRDTLARLGGDEFGVLLEHCAPEQALRIARGLVQAVQEFDFVWEAKRFTVGVSIGLVSIPDGGETLPEVLSAADRACYAAKDKGRNRVHVYAASDEELAQRKGEMQWIPRLHQALAQDRFRLYAQPIRALGDHDGDGEYQEVLLRLTDDEKGVLLPGAFIPAAERYQQMQALDRWVIKTALANLGAHRDSAVYGINVSGQSLGDAGFLDYVTEQLEGSGAGPSQVCFEITETAVITDLKHALNFMHALKQRGCRFALDDFGSGLSSFGYLKTLPVDYLKIDGRFVQDIAQDRFDLAIVQAIQQVAQVLGIKTIAESVETEPILERLRAIGVDYAQGYAIAYPGPLPDP
ncbi:MAG: EAL domain-containing protein [Pseudomonadota bacterium]|nr:EAL domain-containing protein [Pseudomonadota bacterium]